MQQLSCFFQKLFVTLRPNKKFENLSAFCGVEVCNFRRDEDRSFAFGEQTLIVNYFILL